MTKNIKLPTRGSKNYLIFKRKEDDFYIYSLKTEIPSIGCTIDSNNNYIAVDPESGPYMDLGFKIKNLELIKITDKLELYFKKI